MECKICGKPVQNKHYQLCSDCIFKKNHNGLSRIEYYQEKSKVQKRKATGEKDLFIKIWRERPHYCTKCGKWLGDEPKSFFFSHIRSKGACPELRLVPNNIELLCFNCHQQYEFSTK